MFLIHQDFESLRSSMIIIKKKDTLRVLVYEIFFIFFKIFYQEKM